MVRRAVWDFVLYRNADPVKQKDRYELAVDAAGWLFWDGEDPEGEDGFTFLHICSALELDAKRFRERVLTLTREDIQKLNNHIKEG